MILVVGDIILDRYVRGEATRLAPEAPVPVVLLDDLEPELRLGGAANVAASVAAVGEAVHLMGHYGNDREKDLQSLCTSAGVTLACDADWSATTTTKTRIVDGNGRLLIRLDREKTCPWSANGLSDFLDDKRPDTVVFSDYNKGCWTYDNWKIITDYFDRCARAFAQPRKLVVDAKRRFDLYRGAGLVKCNQHEWDRFGADHMLDPVWMHAIVTKGKLGLSYGEPPGCGKAGFRQWTDFPATKHDVHDVTGAGDVAMAVIAVGISREAPMEKICKSAVAASSVSVTKPMTGVANPADIDFGNTDCNGGS